MKLTGFTLNKGTNKGDTATVFITASPNTGLRRSTLVSIINYPKGVLCD